MTEKISALEISGYLLRRAARGRLADFDKALSPVDLIELRHLIDYKPQSVAAKEAKRAYDRAERFLCSIERVLGEPVWGGKP
ncbi:MAG: hypothetical protein HY314_15970 [Acidobacteria bacterium]|nr:hypothetical protein [Acidobacteriota bacterium]